MTARPALGHVLHPGPATRASTLPTARASTQARSRELLTDFQDLSPEEYFSRPPATPILSLTPSPALARGESSEYDPSLLFPSQSYQSDVPHSPATSTSGASLTSASTAPSEPMSRSITNEAMYGLDMLRLSSTYSYISECDLSNPTDPDEYGKLAASLNHPSFDPQHPPVPPSQSFPQNYSQVYFPSSTEMEHSPSQESVASSASSHSSQSSRMSQRVHEQNVQSKNRRLAPKMERNDSSSSKGACEPQLVKFTASDGTVQHKIEISRAERLPTQRKATFCKYCDDQPNGFHGEHELRRHIERQHTQRRKVWVCKDNSPDGKFLSHCKQCRSNKAYGANYNAAAHLRRTHFNPCRFKRGGKGKVSENRGGKGGGDQPSMEVLKDWMYEKWEVNVAGNVVGMADVSNVAVAPPSEDSWMAGLDNFSYSFPYTAADVFQPVVDQDLGLVGDGFDMDLVLSLQPPPFNQNFMQ